MKKTKQDQSNPISLSSKRHSLQQDKLIAPQKIDWNSPLQAMDNNHNKSFFNNMKVELSNIRSDFEKLVQREQRGSGVLGTKEKQMIEQKNGWSTSEKVKSYSSYKPEQRYFTDKKTEPSITQQPNKIKDTPEAASKGFNLSKNINEAVNFKNKHISNRDTDLSNPNNPINKYIAQEAKQAQTNTSNYASVNSKKYSTNFSEASNEKTMIIQKIQNQRQKQKLQQQITIQKAENLRLKGQMNKLTAENNSLIAKMTKMLTDQAQKNNRSKNDNEHVGKYNELLDKFNRNEQKLIDKQKEILQLQQSIKNEREEKDKQLFFCQQQIRELSFYNSNFYNDNLSLTQENNRLTQVINNLQKLLQDSKRINSQNEAEFQRKLEYLQKSVKEYEKREVMLEKEIQRLCEQINSQNASISQAKNHVKHDYTTEEKQSLQNASVTEQMHYLRTQLDKQKEINSLLTKKYKQQLEKLNIQSIVSSLEETIQQLTDQNGQLKSQCNSLSSKIHQLEEQNRAYCNQIKLYEEREKAGEANRNLSSNEWQEFTEKIDLIETENKRLRDMGDYKQLLQEVLNQKESFNIAFEIKEDYEILLKAGKAQLDEISKLRFDIQKLQIKLRLCEEDRQQLRLQKIRLEQEIKAFLSFQRTVDTHNLMKNYEKLRLEAEQNEMTIRKLKQFIRHSLTNRQVPQ